MYKQGTGKGVLTACLMHKFEKCMGIEILDNLYDQSLLMKEQYEKSFDASKDHPKFEVYKGDMLNSEDLDWSNADLVLANSTCFD